jgi:hypothetical protein
MRQHYKGTSKNHHRSRAAWNLLANDSGLFPFRFCAVHPKDAGDCKPLQYFEVPITVVPAIKMSTAVERFLRSGDTGVCSKLNGRDVDSCSNLGGKGFTCVWPLRWRRLASTGRGVDGASQGSGTATCSLPKIQSSSARWSITIWSGPRCVFPL